VAGFHGIQLPSFEAADAGNHGTLPHHALCHVTAQHHPLGLGWAERILVWQVVASGNPGGMTPRTTTSSGRRRRTKCRDVHCRRQRHLASLRRDFGARASPTGSVVKLHLIVDCMAMALLAPRTTRSSRSHAGGGTSGGGGDAAHSAHRRSSTGTMHGRAHGLLIVRVDDDGGGTRRNRRRTVSTTRRVSSSSSSHNSSSKTDRRRAIMSARAWAVG
jgi:hypothetical protein